MKKAIYPTLLALLALVMACSPPATTPPPPAPAPPPAAPAPALSPEAAAWAKVVSDAKTEGKLTLYAFSFTSDIGVGLSRAFQDKYGVTMEIITGRGSELIERLRTEKRMGNVVGDVMESSNLNVVTAKDAGVLTAAGALPVLQERDVWLATPALDPEGVALSYVAAPTSVWINTNLVRPGQEPKTWRDLLDPRWKGKILMLDPTVSSGPYLTFIPLLNNKVIDEDYLRALGKQDLVLDILSTRELFKKTAAGQYPLFVGASAATAGPIIMEGGPIRLLDMAEGVAVSGLGIGLVNQGPHPNAGRVFLNWLLSPEGQTLQSRLQAAPPVRKDAQDFTLPAARITPQRLIPNTQKDLADATRLFRDRYLVQLLKSK